jgi:two-component system phosphate regulon response regulator PhoB
MAAILIIEDDADIRALLKMHCEAAGYSVDEIGDGGSALKLLKQKTFDLCLIDWMLPQISGLEVLQSIRKSAPKAGAQTAVMMITARTAAEDIVAALDAGADDYITKPFESSVLIARISAVLRRRMPPVKADSQTFSLGELKVNFSTFDVYCGESRVHLTKSEFKLLQSLIEERGRVLTRTQLIDLVQGAGISVVDRAIDTHIFGLRKKLGDCSEWIETIRGVGYRVRPD